MSAFIHLTDGHAASLALASLGPQIALVVFIVIFIGVIAWLWIVPKKRWNRDARLPIDDAPRAAERNETDRGPDHERRASPPEDHS